MFLDDLCSDMSHQGRCQDEADLELIREHPDIFPNFYLLPMPLLERKCILELREFVLNAIEHFRWLVVAIDQSTSGIEDFFMQWREHRLILHREIKASNLRHYYRTSEFRADFQAFVRQHEAGKHPAVGTLLDFEDAVRESTLADRSQKPSGSLLAPGCDLRWDDVSSKKDRTILIEFPHDVQTVIEGLRFRSVPVSSGNHHFYVRREASAGTDGIERISDWLACVLRYSDGRHSIEELVRQLAIDIPEVEESMRNYAFVRLLEESHARGFIEIYRTCGDIPGG